MPQYIIKAQVSESECLLQAPKMESSVTEVSASSCRLQKEQWLKFKNTGQGMFALTENFKE